MGLQRMAGCLWDKDWVEAVTARGIRFQQQIFQIMSNDSPTALPHCRESVGNCCSSSPPRITVKEETRETPNGLFQQSEDSKKVNAWLA